jgi:type I restriction enzyme M protein
LFKKSSREGYSELKVSKDQIKATIFSYPEFVQYSQKVKEVFEGWKKTVVPQLKSLKEGDTPKKVIHELGESLLAAFGSLQLIDNYDVYQHLMSYWAELMQDDVYVISDDGWSAGKEVYRIVKQTKNKDGKVKEKEVEGMEGIESKLLKPILLINKYFGADKMALEKMEAERDGVIAEIEAMEEEHGVEDGLMAEAKNEKDKITPASVKERLKKIKGNKADADEQKLLDTYLKLSDQLQEFNKDIKEAQILLEEKVWNKYKDLTEEEIKTLVVDDKWMGYLQNAFENEMQRISQRLTQRVKELAVRYEAPMPAMLDDLKQLEEKVNTHLAKMGFTWN